MPDTVSRRSISLSGGRARWSSEHWRVPTSRRDQWHPPDQRTVPTENGTIRSSWYVAALVWLVGFYAASPAAVADAELPLTLEPGTMTLFVDDHAISSHDGLRRTLRQPRKDDDGQMPLIAAKPGTGLLAYGTIVFDTRLDQYVMFTQEFPSRQMYRSTSADGLSWHDNGRLEPITFAPALPIDAETKPNIGIDLFSCYYDTRDTPYPYKGWLYYANYGNAREGIYFVRSSDGKQWERGRQVVNAYADVGDPTCQTIHQDDRTVYGPGDVTLFSHDAKTNRFLGLFKFFTTEPVGPGNHLRSRAYAFFDRLDEPFDIRRLDRIALLPPAADAEGNRPCDEFYASTAWRIGDLWLGGLKVFHACDDYPWSAAGCAFLKLVVSRDGLNWKKVPFANDAGVPEIFLANGEEGGNDGRNDGGYISEFSQGPLRIGDELVYYFSASSFGKNRPPTDRLRGGGIFRARLRPEGFVSIDGGTLTTRPLRFEGEELIVNAVGPVEVTVLTLGGQPLASARLTGDSLAHEVRFDGRSLRRIAPSGTARLRFAVDKPGRLYAFSVR
ncbi:MAG: hypothetical protein JXA69_05375 [Phycisphaerae bacterium]|nr:hypothetical protein [Phycisphaerae bacterium]